jgi:hypothetical protein
MSRHEADREDLMAEATALCERIEIALPGEAEHVVAGFRDEGRFSLYFGPDPVFHFDADGALRRAFVGGDLYRSQAQTVARLMRSRAGTAVNLVRHDLDAGELETFLAAMQARLDQLLAALRSGAAQVIQQVPADVDLLPRLIAAVDAARQGRLSAAIKKRKE